MRSFLILGNVLELVFFSQGLKSGHFSTFQDKHSNVAKEGIKLREKQFNLLNFFFCICISIDFLQTIRWSFSWPLIGFSTNAKNEKNFFALNFLVFKQVSSTFEHVKCFVSSLGVV